MEIIIFFDDFIKLKYHNSPVSNFDLKIGQGITKCNTFKKKKIKHLKSQLEIQPNTIT